MPFRESGFFQDENAPKVPFPASFLAGKPSSKKPLGPFYGDSRLSHAGFFGFIFGIRK